MDLLLRHEFHCKFALSTVSVAIPVVVDLLLRQKYRTFYGKVKRVAIPVVVDLLLRQIQTNSYVHATRVAIPVVVDLLLRPW